ncbi:hypothetical protein C1H46_005886 [Malus baccata]|uniref:Uncharacterized protein n=1 Tax=Malus baccata TaxID=106549 RepID=A0A540NDK0_MALBA|nr:hypothetical protein C1H46_005886 [Malus baccata]
MAHFYTIECKYNTLKKLKRTGGKDYSYYTQIEPDGIWDLCKFKWKWNYATGMDSKNASTYS